MLGRLRGAFVPGGAGRAYTLSMHARLLASSLLVSIALLTLPVAAQKKARTAIDAYLRRCATFGWSGVVLVEHGGKVILHEGYGYADREKKRKHQKNTLFEIASATKPFTACAVLALVEDGVLDLDDTIDEHLPGVPKTHAKITIRHLLSHTSGMPRSAGGGHGADLERAVAGYLSVEPSARPGKKYEYWNGGFALLAGIVETTTGKSYEDVCRERLFTPAGLKQSGFTGEQFLTAQQALGYRKDSEPRLAGDHPYGSYGYQYRGMGGLVTSAAELARFGNALLDGKVLEEDMVELMHTPVRGHYGLGWQVSQTSRGRLRIGHGGDVAGFHTGWFLFPEERAQVIVLMNVDDIPKEWVTYNVAALLFGDPLPFSTPPAAGKVKKRDLDAVAGRYVHGSGDSIRVRREDDHIVVAVEAAANKKKLPKGDVAKKLRPAVDLARKVLELIQAKDDKALEPLIIERVPRSWASTLTTLVWPQQIQSHGELEEARLLDAEENEYGVVIVRFQLQHANAIRPLTIFFEGGKLSRLDLQAPLGIESPLDAYAGAYVLQENGLFATYTWDSPLPRTLRFDKGKRPKRVRADDGRKNLTLERAK